MEQAVVKMKGERTVGRRAKMLLKIQENKAVKD